jgi:hypothetical protein
MNYICLDGDLHLVQTIMLEKYHLYENVKKNMNDTNVDAIHVMAQLRFAGNTGSSTKDCNYKRLTLFRHIQNSGFSVDKTWRRNQLSRKLLLLQVSYNSVARTQYSVVQFLI